MSEPPHYKVVLVGDGNVGKTSLVRRFCEGKFEESRILTIGVDFQIKTVKLGEREMRLSIWDVAGQERFRTFRDQFYRGIDWFVPWIGPLARRSAQCRTWYPAGRDR